MCQRGGAWADTGEILIGRANTTTHKIQFTKLVNNQVNGPQLLQAQNKKFIWGFFPVFIFINMSFTTQGNVRVYVVASLRLLRRSLNWRVHWVSKYYMYLLYSTLAGRLCYTRCTILAVYTLELRDW